MFAKTNLVIFAVVTVTLIINIINFIIQKPINVSRTTLTMRLLFSVGGFWGRKFREIALLSQAISPNMAKIYILDLRI